MFRVTLRIVIAPDSFKGSLSAQQVCKAIERGWRSVRNNDEIVLAPQADGGEGTLDAIQSAVVGSVRHDAGLVTGPDGRPTQGEWLELPGKIGVVELAQSSGLPLMNHLDALNATTRGLGEVIGAALDYGINSLVIAVGGSASTDGGAGALTALGLQLMDSQNRIINDGGRALSEISHIDSSNLRAAPTGGVVILTDVDSPLLGPRGAAAIFGPQKGATPEDIVKLNNALKHFSDLLGGDINLVGGGAAGGTAYGFATVWGASIQSGADYVARICKLQEVLESADLLITGEGSFDQQSLGGKVVGQLLKKAKSLKIESAVIAGQVKVNSGAWQCALEDIAGSTDAAMENPMHWLKIAGEKAALELTI
jgi:glycerate kinase